MEDFIWEAILWALLCTPGPCSSGDCPDAALAAVQRWSVYPRLCGPHESWEGYPFVKGVDWLKPHAWNLRTYPDTHPLSKFPPYTVCLDGRACNVAFSFAMRDWRHHADALGCAGTTPAVLVELALRENDRLWATWCELCQVREVSSEKAAVKRLQGYFAQVWPEYYWSPAFLPTLPRGY